MGNISQTFVIQNSTLNIILQSSSQKFAKKKIFFVNLHPNYTYPCARYSWGTFNWFGLCFRRFIWLCTRARQVSQKAVLSRPSPWSPKHSAHSQPANFPQTMHCRGAEKKFFVKYVTNCIQNSFTNKIATSRKNMLSSIIIIITIFNDVSDIKNLRGENAIVDLELAAESWHLEDKYRWYSFQFDTRSKEWLLKEFLNTWKRFGFVSLNK